MNVLLYGGQNFTIHDLAYCHKVGSVVAPGGVSDQYSYYARQARCLCHTESPQCDMLRGAIHTKFSSSQESIIGTPLSTEEVEWCQGLLSDGGHDFQFFLLSLIGSKCAIMPPGHIFKYGQSVVIPTFAQIELVECTEPDAIGHQCSFHPVSSSSVIYVGAEITTFYLQANYWTSFMHSQATGTPTFVIDYAGNTVSCQSSGTYQHADWLQPGLQPYLCNADGSFKGTNLQFLLSDLLAWAGTNLDKWGDAPMQQRQKWVPADLNVPVRITGATLRARISYSNLHSPFAYGDYRRTMTFDLSIGEDRFQRPVDMMNSTHGQKVTEAGIRIVFITEGRLGTFNFGILVATLTSGLVLLTLSKSTVQTVAKYMFVEFNVLGKEFVREREDGELSIEHLTIEGTNHHYAVVNSQDGVVRQLTEEDSREKSNHGDEEHQQICAGTGPATESSLDPPVVSHPESKKMRRYLKNLQTLHTEEYLPDKDKDHSPRTTVIMSL